MRFPGLKTGAVAQYPAQRRITCSTDIVRFVDGTEQRSRRRAAAAHIWVVRLELLDDAELGRLADFFNAAQGRSASFEFQDPWTSAIHSNCSLEIDELATELAGEGRAATVLVIRENAG